MPKLTYYEQLKQPKWQKKRLEIMERANYKCEECGEDTVQLHIHHGYYEKGLMLWEYDNDTLLCVCKDCHESFKNALTGVHKNIAKLSFQELNNLRVSLERQNYNDGPGPEKYFKMSQKARDRRANGKVPCIISGRWIKFPQKSCGHLNIGEPIDVSIMTHSDTKNGSIKLCDMVVTREDLINAVSAVIDPG